MGYHIILDGYNVIRQLPALADRERRSLEAGRKALLDRLVPYRRATGHRLTVVFDGVEAGWYEEQRTRERGVEVIYTPRGTTADETIVRLAREASHGAVVVVTADREVARQVERYKGAVLAPAAFEARLDALVSGRAEEANPDGPSPDEGRDDEPDDPGPGHGRPAKRGNPRKAPKTERRANQRLKKL